MSGFKQLNDTEKLQRPPRDTSDQARAGRIAEKNPELARLLKETIKTGTYLSYMAVAPKSVPRRKRPSEGEKTRPSSRKNPIRQ